MEQAVTTLDHPLTLCRRKSVGVVGHRICEAPRSRSLEICRVRMQQLSFFVERVVRVLPV